MRTSMMAGMAPTTSTQPNRVTGGVNFRQRRSEPVRERPNPVRRLFQLFVEIGRAAEYQINNHLGDPQQQAVGQTIKNAAEQAQEKASAIRTDKTPELFQKIGHGFYFCKCPAKRKPLF